MDGNRVLIAGGGIGGLATALTLHQIGVPCTVFEAVGNLRPMGVGINLQPNAVRELFDLGIGADALDRVGLPAREWALVGLNGNDIHVEPRGLEAGYAWPQYAVHRGALQMLLCTRRCATGWGPRRCAPATASATTARGRTASRR
jgi:5-methylphenazine-1-carboxylate 1-monooxygenase